MDTEAHLDDALEHGVLSEDDGGSISLSSSFSHQVEDAKRRLAGRGTDEVAAMVSDDLDDQIRDNLTELSARDLDTVAVFLALHDTGLSQETGLRLLPLVDQLTRGIPRSDGAPEPFVPIRGDQLRSLSRIYNLAIAYVWLEECRPCDAMRAELTDALSDAADDIALFAVYGPEWAALLEEEFDVVTGPTTLFLSGGSIETRLVGAKSATVIESEIGRLRR